MDDVDAAVVGKDEPEEEPLPVGGVLSSEQRELRGAASGRDAAGQQDAGLNPAQDGDATESTDGEAEEAQVSGVVVRSNFGRRVMRSYPWLCWFGPSGHSLAWGPSYTFQLLHRWIPFRKHSRYGVQT